MCLEFNRLPASPQVETARYAYTVILRSEGVPGNMESVVRVGTNVTADPHWVRVQDGRDTVLLVPASLVRRVVRVGAVTEGGEQQ